MPVVSRWRIENLDPKTAMVAIELIGLSMSWVCDRIDAAEHALNAEQGSVAAFAKSRSRSIRRLALLRLIELLAQEAGDEE